MKTYEEYVEIIEKLFEENRAKEAEAVLLSAVNEARETSNSLLELQLLNELIGYYRQTSEKEKLQGVLDASMEAGNRIREEVAGGNLLFATTVLNVANGYRSIGELSKSKECYETVLAIYSKEEPADSMNFAGLYNNMSLLYQEMGDFNEALECLKKALVIVKANNAGFETAVTYANLANTAVMVEKASLAPDFSKAKEYAELAMDNFAKRDTFDPHYCAALSALGLCYYYEKQYRKAAEMFKRGMNIVEANLGHNSQYLRLKENFEMASREFYTGLQISKMYFEEYGRPMLEKNFSEYISEMTVGLCGEGSDCYGYDDETSMDHDWGPDFCIWLSDDLYEKLGEELTKAYEALPSEYMGYKRTLSKKGTGRRGVLRTADFYQRIVGAKTYEDINWSEVSDYALSCATNGEIFIANDTEFMLFRNKLLCGYPENILYLKFSDDFAKICQSGQYNYARMIKREDRVTADLMLSECIKQIMLLCHHANNVYPPHDKWLYRSFRDVEKESTIVSLVNMLHKSFSMQDSEALEYVSELMERVGAFFANRMYAQNFISDISTYLDEHTDELVRKASYASYSDKELVTMIAKLEFKAFDKVKNEGGRASCQNDWPTFSVMRKSQYLTWSRPMLLQYLYDFSREFELGHNLITEKYGRMMESTAPEKYREIASNFPELSPTKKAVIEQIVAIQISMLEAFGEEYPNLAGNARSFHTYEDNYVNTSYETYLRGEISTYSDKMLQLYGQYVVGAYKEGKNIARMTIENTARLYGFDDLESFEKGAIE